MLGRRAAVNLLLTGDYEYSVLFEQDGRGRWYEAVSSSGHADRSLLEALDEEA